MVRLWLPARGGPLGTPHPSCWPPGRERAQRLHWRQEGLGTEGSRGRSPGGDARLQSRAKQSRTGGRAAHGMMLAHPNQQGQLIQSHCHVPWPHREGMPCQHRSPQGLPGAQASLGAFILMSTTWLFFLQP